MARKKHILKIAIVFAEIYHSVELAPEFKEQNAFRFSNGVGIFSAKLSEVSIIYSSQCSGIPSATGQSPYKIEDASELSRLVIDVPSLEVMRKWRLAIAKREPTILWPPETVE